MHKWENGRVRFKRRWQVYHRDGESKYMYGGIEMAGCYGTRLPNKQQNKLICMISVSFIWTVKWKLLSWTDHTLAQLFIRVESNSSN